MAITRQISTKHIYFSLNPFIFVHYLILCFLNASSSFLESRRWWWNKQKKSKVGWWLHPFFSYACYSTHSCSPRHIVTFGRDSFGTLKSCMIWKFWIRLILWSYAHWKTLRLAKQEFKSVTKEVERCLFTFVEVRLFYRYFYQTLIILLILSLPFSF